MFVSQLLGLLTDLCVLVDQWETVTMSSTGGDEISSGERGVTWRGQERGRRGGGMTGKTGGHTHTHTLCQLCCLWLCHGIFVWCREWDRSRERRRDYDRGRRERFSPSRHISPQHKRMRRDWWVAPLSVYAVGMKKKGPPVLWMKDTFRNIFNCLLLCLSGRSTGGSPTAMSYPTGEVAAPIQGWGGLRAGTLTSLPCTHTMEVTLCRAGSCSTCGRTAGPL